MPPFCAHGWGPGPKKPDPDPDPLVRVVEGPVIVGAGPAGLATAASLRAEAVPSLVIERADCIASLWKYKTYDRLRLHIPKHLCELPLMPFPEECPAYPSRQDFIAYLEEYAARFQIKPQFNETVTSATFDSAIKLWRVRTCRHGPQLSQAHGQELIEYVTRWLVVATGENAEAVTPRLPGMDLYAGPAFHSSLYRNGSDFRDKRVLVVGCGNSGMEIALDLANHGARPSIAVRSPVHVLPREVLGRSTLQVAMTLLRVFPLWLTDYIVVLYTWLLMGNTARYGICRPAQGPIELKDSLGKTPVLDVGTLAKIRSGHVKVTTAVHSLTACGAKFVDGTSQEFDSIIWATGFMSNVITWLKDDTFFGDNGLPRDPFPHKWKGQQGLYVVGMSKRGLKGTSFEATQIAHHISMP